MDDSENSQPQDESDEDIYKDFPVFNFEDELAKLEGSKETYKQEAQDLSEKLKQLTEENKELKKSNEVLKKNLSTLLKTAQAEVQRKDSMIEELRNKVESITFRRNKKQTKEKFTSTEDLEIQTEVKSDVKEFKNVSDDNRLKSYENRTSGVSDCSKSCEENDKKRLKVRKEKSLSCDSDSKSGHYKNESRRFSSKHYSNERRYSDRHSRDHQEYDKKIYSGSSKTQRENSRSRRREEKRRRERDESPERRRSKQKDESPERRKSKQKDESPHKRRSSRKEEKPARQSSNRKEESPDKRRKEDKQKLTDSGKEGSCSSAQSKRSKESSSDKPNNDSVNRIREQNSNNERDTDCNKTSAKNEEHKKQTGSSKVDCVKVNEKQSKNEKKNEKRSVPAFNTKSPLDALYSEMVISRSHNRKPGGITHQETESKDSRDLSEPEDWALSFKNERSNSSKPMTLYSKRMMQKFANETKAARNEEEEEQGEEEQGKEEVIPNTIESKIVEKPQETNKIIDDEKEPGELTDDENVVESSKEFQELTKKAAIETPVKMASEEYNAEELAQERVDNVKEVKQSEFLKPGELIFVAGETVCQKDTEFRDVIEFSPFKNNYKLIEISPIKPPGPEHILDFYKKRLPSTGQSHKEVEKSIFNLLSSLSGVPIKKVLKATEKKDSGHEKERELSEKEMGSSPEVETPQNERKPEGKVNNSKPKSRSSNSEVTTRKGKKCEKSTGKQENQGSEDNTEEVTGPGETTQFLDFFLLTTSPSKPIVPEPPETLNKSEPEESAKKNDTSESSKNSSTEKDSDDFERSLKITESPEEPKKTKDKTNTKKECNEEISSGRRTRRTSTKRENDTTDDKNQKRKRGVSECEPGETDAKRAKLEFPQKRTRHKQNSKTETDSTSEPETKTKEDISTFEFFKPIAKQDKRGEEENVISNTTEYKMSLTEVVSLQTPDKGMGKLKNLVLNEQSVCLVTDSKNNPAFSPLVGSKFVEMTPRRLLKNDLMLTDSEDESTTKANPEVCNAEEEEEGSESENSECDSDSGASDFVDLL